MINERNERNRFKRSNLYYPLNHFIKQNANLGFLLSSISDIMQF